MKEYIIFKLHGTFVSVGMAACFICFVLLSGSSAAQNFVIYGNIRDSIDKTGVAYARITVIDEADNKHVSTGITGENGAYETDKLPDGIYSMKIACLGYETKIVEGIKCATGQRKLKLDVEINLDVKVLDSVTVTADRTAIEFRPDKKIIHIDPAETAGGASVAEFLKSVPEIRVDGKTVTLNTYEPTILVNGKPAGPAMKELTEIPATLIASVEIISNPSVRYNPEGIGGIINLKTRRMSMGINGMMQGSAGTNSKANGAGTLNYRTKQWNVFANVHDLYSGTKTDGEVNELYDTGNSIRQTMSLTQNINRITTRIGADYEPDNLNVFTLYWEFSSRGGTHKINNDYESVLPARTYESRQTENMKSNDNNISFSYIHTFADDAELSVDASQFFGREPSNTEFFYKDSQTLNYFNDTGFDTNETELNINYSSSIFKDWDMETGTTFNVERNESRDSLYGNRQAEYYNVVNLNRLTNAYYLSLGKKVGKFGFRAGLRGEYTNQNLRASGFDSRDRTYFDVFPNAGVNFRINDNFNLNLNYGRRIKRPSVLALSPAAAIDARYPSERRIGNPDLKPAYGNSLNLSGYRQWTNVALSSSAAYMTTDNDIADVYYTKNDLTYITRKNIAASRKFLFDLNVDLYAKLWNVYRPILTVSMNQNRYDSYDAGGNGVRKNFFNWDIGLNNVFYLPKKWHAFLVARYYPGTYSYASTTEAMTDLKLTVRKTFDNNLTVTLVFHNILNSKPMTRLYGDGFTSVKTENNHTQALFFGIMYKFGKPVKTRSNVNLNIDGIETQ